MPRLRDTRTGVVVNVDDDTAVSLGAAYEPVGEKSTAKTTAKRASSSNSSK